MTRDGLRVIAGGYGDDTRATFVFRQERESVGRAALLEGAGGLKVVKLQHHVAARRTRDRVAVQRRRPQHPPGDARGRRLNIREVDHPRPAADRSVAAPIAAQPNRTPRTS